MSEPLVSIIVRTKDRPGLLIKACRVLLPKHTDRLKSYWSMTAAVSWIFGEIGRTLGDVSLNYIRLETNTGRAHAGSVGIDNAKGQYVGFLMIDDEYYPDHIETLLQFLGNSDYRIAYTDSELVFKEFDPETAALKETGRQPFISRDYIFENLLIENYIPLMNILLPREELDAAGRFDESFDVYEDWDLLIRCASRSPFSI